MAHIDREAAITELNLKVDELERQKIRGESGQSFLAVASGRISLEQAMIDPDLARGDLVAHLTGVIADIQDFLGGRKGSDRVHYDVESIARRLAAGNNPVDGTPKMSRDNLARYERSLRVASSLPIPGAPQDVELLSKVLDVTVGAYRQEARNLGVKIIPLRFATNPAQVLASK